MNKAKFLLILSVFYLFLLSSCSMLNNPTKIKTYAYVATSEGDFVIGLYQGTPLHRDSFMDNCSNGVYDSLLVYSTVPFGLYRMGLHEDQKEKDLMNSNIPEKTISSEFNERLLHKKGAVGMYRLYNDKNPEKLSDFQVFYLVDGISTDEKTLRMLEAKRNAPLIADYITVFLSEEGNQHYKDSLDNLRIQGRNKEWKELYIYLTETIKPRIENDGKKLFKLSDYQVETYTEYGGAPIYDGEYTVFGEIVSGIDILTILSNQKTDLHRRPKKNIYILSTRILSKKEFKELKL